LDPVTGHADTVSGERETTALLISSGIAGHARIDQLTDTGTAINDNPQIRFELTVTLAGRRPYRTTLTQIVRRDALAHFHLGATVPVRVSPRDEQTLMFV
jgi:hypothetical protein